MFLSPLYQACLWSAAWRRRLAYYWLGIETESLLFFSMFGALILGVVGIARFAYVDSTRIQPAQIQVAQRATTLARRRANDLECLAQNVYFEARGEPLEGQYAVAEVTLNRTRTDHFPHTVCGVVHEARWSSSRGRYIADFSWTELGGMSPPDDPAWKLAMVVASAAYEDLHEPLVPGALYYHATSVRPAWSKSRKAVATIGRHIFYL
ncbi:MAG TPA: cell wall hydrolase [Steroidobacteraceae bacterium]|nr:cell wall hydrolase [Steroidobacteraceae bacterium]